MKWLILTFIILANSFFVLGEEENLRSIHVRKTVEGMKVDGMLNESAWQVASKADQFWQQYPFDTSHAITRTEVMITYDDNNLYIGAVCYDDIPGEYVIQSLKRDYAYPVSDGFYVYLDPFGDQTNGFSFGVNPLGVQREGLLQYGGSMGVTTYWDNKWHSEVKQFEGYWTVEMAIPFNTLRYKEGEKTWRVNFGRNDLKRNENSSWIKVPRNFNISTLAFTGEMIFEIPPEKEGANVALIPYAINTIEKDYVTGQDKIKPNAGLDAKIVLSTSLNLDLTINPDFAQVDVDRQVTNLSRFSLFFPERRNFFLENSDLFERFGFRQIRPFFSRRIGLNNGSPVPILFGARLSGKINRTWRIGVMNMQTEGGSDAGLNAQNYSVAATTFQLKGRSNISAILVNRQGFNGNKADWGDYNRIAGIDWNIASKNNNLMGKLFYHHSFSPGITENNFAHASWLHYEKPSIVLEWNHEYVGNNYQADVGFVPRIEFYNPETGQIVKKSYWRLEPFAQYKFYPKKGSINNHGPWTYMSQYFDGSYKENERLLQAGYEVNFQNSAAFSVHAANNFVLLYFDQDITFSGNKKLEAGGYTWYNYRVNYQSNIRKKFNYSLHADFGEYYTGHKNTFAADLNYRKQPWGIFGLTAENNTINMPEGFDDVNFWLIGPRIEISFSKSLFFSGIMQYNTQVENVNIYSRLQWRFRPMSDLFIVYSENYYSTDFTVKNRALAVKLVWWINV